MKKNYILSLFLFIALMFTQTGVSQSRPKNLPIQEAIDGLSIYPNPVSNGKLFIYIATKRDLLKKVEIFNVLGKQVFSTFLSGKELNISKLNTGVYILKITENDISETRKLVIK